MKTDNTMKLLAAVLLLMVSPIIVSADGMGSFAEAEAIIDSKAPCNELSDAQLEIMGDYYMEQMHPGEAHERMDEMMGGEGSESLREIHIRMAKAFYCGEHEVMSGMMGTMMGSSGMMGASSQRTGGMGMMDGYGFMGWGFGMGLVWLLYLAIAAFVFGTIFWWTKKLVSDDKPKRKR